MTTEGREVSQRTLALLERLETFKILKILWAKRYL